MRLLAVVGMCVIASVAAFQPSRYASDSCPGCNTKRLSPLPFSYQHMHLVAPSFSFRLKAGNDESSNESAFHMPPATSKLPKPLLAASALLLLDILFRRLLMALTISFPSSLAGCGILSLTFLVGPNGHKLYDFLQPGSALLAKWLPVFFVPSLITLPLADSAGSVTELIKVALVMVGGFYFTLLTTAWTAVGIRKLFPAKSDTNEPPIAMQTNSTATVITISNNAKPSKPFSDSLNNNLRLLTALSFTGATLAANTNSFLSTPATTLFMLCTTLTSFVFGARLPKKFTKVVHPLVTCTAITWAYAMLFAKLSGNSFLAMLKSYRTRHLGLFAAGAGDLLMFLLGPAVVSLSCQMYDRRKLMRENLGTIGAAIGVSSFGGLFGTAAAVRGLQIASPYLRLSLLSRNITSPLAMAIAGIFGADVSIAVSIVVITGVIGANFGAAILDSFCIQDPVARGLGIGAAAHGLGTAAFLNEEDAFPFAAIAMALTASAATVIASIPVFKKWILQLALGV